MIDAFQAACFISVNVFGIKFKGGDYKNKNTWRISRSFQCNRLIALAFVPVSGVIKGFDVIADEFDDDAEDLLCYFEKNMDRGAKGER